MFEWLGQEELRVMVLALVFAATALLVGGLLWGLTGEVNPVERRLRTLTERGSDEDKGGGVEGGFKVSWLEPVGRLILPEEGWQRSRLRTRLVRAGYRSEQAMHVFLGAKVLLAIGLAVAVLVVFSFALFVPVATIKGALTLVGAAVAGFYLPDAFLEQRSSARRRQLEEQFPDAMDMLVVCVEAGLGLDAAIHRVGSELAYSHPALAEEFRVLGLELRAGKSRNEALHALADRTNLDDVRALVSVLIQAENFGTSIAEAVRQHAEEMRATRIQRAREKAAKLPVKLIFPILLFIFPAMFLVILGPAAIQIVKGLTAVAGG